MVADYSKVRVFIDLYVCYAKYMPERSAPNVLMQLFVLYVFFGPAGFSVNSESVKSWTKT